MIGSIGIECDNCGSFKIYSTTDTTKIKQGKFTPGTKIKIINPKNRPNKSSEMIALLLAWNYKTAIIKNEKKFLRNGGKFLIPIPKPRIVNR